MPLDVYKRQTQKYRALVEEELAQIEKPWIRAYYENLLSQAESRNIRERYEKTTAYKELSLIHIYSKYNKSRDSI